ncbi:MAG: ankyrin repeat domain-containing protein [Pseudomonas sp.]|jgi:ankyrin repeat protein|nr:ankyrin repeat domain-containing protein [Pseudomonas sp.]
MGEFEFENVLSRLMRDCDLQQLLDFVGHDYDFVTDPHDVLNSAAWYGRKEILTHALDHGGSPNGGGRSRTPLASVSSAGNLTLVKLLLERGAEVEVKDKYGSTAIQLAALKGKIPVIKLLLDAGANLHGTMTAAVDELRIPTVKFLIEAGAPLDEIDRNGMTPLLNACCAGKKKGSEIAMLLLRAGADATYVRATDGMSAIKFGYWGYGECSAEVFAELRARGAPEPEPGFEILRLR